MALAWKKGESNANHYYIMMVLCMMYDVMIFLTRRIPFGLIITNGLIITFYRGVAIMGEGMQRERDGFRMMLGVRGRREGGRSTFLPLPSTPCVANSARSQPST